jgi:phosphoglycerate dehydrogenase-like enzyme
MRPGRTGDGVNRPQAIVPDAHVGEKHFSVFDGLGRQRGRIGRKVDEPSAALDVKDDALTGTDEARGVQDVAHVAEHSAVDRAEAIGRLHTGSGPCRSVENLHDVDSTRYRRWSDLKSKKRAARERAPLVHWEIMIARRFHTVHVCVSGGERTRRKIDAFLGGAGREAVYVNDAELVERVGEMEVLLCGTAPQMDWSSARQLRLLQIMGSGTDALWPAAGLPIEVEIANARGIHLPEMRDHALALMLAFERDLFRLQDEQRHARWSPRPAGSVRGKTAAILGLGEVGRSIAESCATLGMRVLGVRTDPRPTPFVAEVYALADLDRVLRAADYLIVALPLTVRTRDRLGAEALSRLRPSAVLVLLSRGGIVDESALEAALRSGKLRGAALDVFRHEPLAAESSLWTCPNLVITPHVAGWVGDYLERALALFVENVDLAERGLPPRTRVLREREY